MEQITLIAYMALFPCSLPLSASARQTDIRPSSIETCISNSSGLDSDDMFCFTAVACYCISSYFLNTCLAKLKPLCVAGVVRHTLPCHLSGSSRIPHSCGSRFTLALVAGLFWNITLPHRHALHNVYERSRLLLLIPRHIVCECFGVGGGFWNRIVQSQLIKTSIKLTA